MRRNETIIDWRWLVCKSFCKPQRFSTFDQTDDYRTKLHHRIFYCSPFTLRPLILFCISDSRPDGLSQSAVPYSVGATWSRELARLHTGMPALRTAYTTIRPTFSAGDKETVRAPPARSFFAKQRGIFYVTQLILCVVSAYLVGIHGDSFRCLMFWSTQLRNSVYELWCNSAVAPATPCTSVAFSCEYSCLLQLRTFYSKHSSYDRYAPVPAICPKKTSKPVKQ